MRWPVPNFHSETKNMQERKLFWSVDFPSSFWQLSLHEDFQHLHTFITDKGVYIPTRTLQGGRNRAHNFQGKFAPCFDEMDAYMKEWIYDFAINSKRERDLMFSLRTFLRICQ